MPDNTGRVQTLPDICAYMLENQYVLLILDLSLYHKFELPVSQKLN